jgi:hypothetical protein
MNFFDQAGLKPWSSQSPPPEQLGLQVCEPSSRFVHKSLRASILHSLKYCLGSGIIEPTFRNSRSLNEFWQISPQKDNFCLKYPKHQLRALFGWLVLVLGFELRACTSSHSASPFFVMGFLEIGSHELFAWTAIFLSSASWVAGITGVSHQRLTCTYF